MIGTAECETSVVAMPHKRKQLDLAPEQQEKVRELAAALGYTEAEIMRQAIDRLPDPGPVRARLKGLSEPERSIVQRCIASGLVLVPDADDEDVPTAPEEIEALEREWEAWVDAQSEPLGLSEAVIEDRR
jgi:hypothetical protein